MKIAIPVEGKSLESVVCQSFGRTPYFLIYNTDTKEAEYIDNSAVSSQGGAGIKAAQIIADNNVKVVIVPRCGENAAKVLKANDIKLYRSTNGSVNDNIKAYIDNALLVLDEIHPGFHNHGGR